MATEKQKKAVEKVIENRGNVSQAMRDAGYSEASAKNPSNLTRSKAWEQLLDKHLPEKMLAQKHKQLLDAKRLDHMVFPVATPKDEIKAMLRSVGCTARKFQVSETQIHCWFWSPDNGAQAKALELGYKLRARLTSNVDLKSGGKPIPILGALGVSSDDSTSEDSEADQTD